MPRSPSVPRLAALALAAAVLALTRPAAAQRGDDAATAARSVDARVDAVVTGGTWTSGGLEGRYRIVIVAEGWEEVRHRAFVQWIAIPRSRGAMRVVASVELTPLAGAFSLTDPRFWLRDGKWTATADASDLPMSSPTRRVTFALGGPGRARLVGSANRVN